MHPLKETNKQKKTNEINWERRQHGFQKIAETQTREKWKRFWKAWRGEVTVTPTRQGWRVWTTMKGRAPPPNEAEALAAVLEAVERFNPVISWGYIAASAFTQARGGRLRSPPTPAPALTIRCVRVCVPVCASYSVRLFVIPWTIACQAPLSTKSSRQQYWPGVPFPSPGDFPDPGVKAGPAALQPDSLRAFSLQPHPLPRGVLRKPVGAVHLLLHLSLALECAHSKAIRTWKCLGPSGKEILESRLQKLGLGGQGSRTSRRACPCPLGSLGQRMITWHRGIRMEESQGLRLIARGKRPCWIHRISSDCF